MDHAPARTAELHSPERSAVGGASGEPVKGTSRARRWPFWRQEQALPRPMLVALFACMGATLAWVFASRIGQGIWEDGYFVKRFAYNYWHHGSFSWNTADGPLYGMTSQTLQVLGTLLYVIS